MNVTISHCYSVQCHLLTTRRARENRFQINIKNNRIDCFLLFRNICYFLASALHPLPEARRDLFAFQCSQPTVTAVPWKREVMEFKSWFLVWDYTVGIKKSSKNCVTRRRMQRTCCKVWRTDSAHFTKNFFQIQSYFTGSYDVIWKLQKAK